MLVSQVLQFVVNGPKHVRHVLWQFKVHKGCDPLYSSGQSHVFVALI